MKIIFSVQTDNIFEFAEILEANELSNKIIGTSDDDILQIEVQYNKVDRRAIEELEDLAVTED